MRSTAFTSFLLVLAAAICGLAGWRISKGNLDALFGVPPATLGTPLYDHFDPSEVEKITVSVRDLHAEFIKTETGWMYAQEPKDRMDPRAAIAIISFSRGLRVEDYAPVKEVDLEKTGLDTNSIRIDLATHSGQALAKYRIGSRTPWFGQDTKTKDPLPTVFIRPRERGRRDFVYTCSGDILELFRDNLKHLRDPRPFYFNPLNLHQIRIRSASGEFTLSHAEPREAWKIVIPQELNTDHDTVLKSLIGNLFELSATNVLDRSAVTLPTSSGTSRPLQIALKNFNEDQETVLEVYPPESPDAREAYATVSDRPNAVLVLPLKPEPELVSIADLPLSVNELRDQTLTNLNPEALKSITINAATAQPVTLYRKGKAPWRTLIEGVERTANESKLYDLLKAVTESRVVEFVTDAATDFSPWGLDRPILRLQFTGVDDESIELRFGFNNHGELFANRIGTSTVVRLDPDILSKIAIRSFEWRDSILWPFSKVDLKNIVRTIPPEAPLDLKYGFIREDWHGEQDGKDISAQIDPIKANYFLNVLGELRVKAWLSPYDEKVRKALINPSLLLSVTQNEVDEFGDTTGEIERILLIGPASDDPNPTSYYGRLNTELNPFTISRETYDKLTSKLIIDN
ncbi:DUF4340 domain-containing protein [Luteolibacter pohnpeiensis]|uniref:DUF4340 domain-containing protein n=1 Tax=Luteolibacter pohnpeiensis TaxID=454153 RepID=A0A934S3Q5_9BACT|nr:DUF4340 domain-containing protein [Luteolibacter pohnpeiensis]MBK1882610.1 DUF4340 domain-containing protein [Luteolibacter pohnpeiensis]